jgi:hypothetical protein
MDFIASHLTMRTVVWTEATISMLSRGAVNKRWNRASMLVRKTLSERFPKQELIGYNKAFYLANLPARVYIWSA